jgi:transposase-like protein
MEGNLLSEFLLKGMQPLLQELLEGEITEFLEREHYERRKEGPHRGYRNGYEPSKVKTAEGEVRIELPQVRDTAELFFSKLREFSWETPTSGETYPEDVCKRSFN